MGKKSKDVYYFNANIYNDQNDLIRATFDRNFNDVFIGDGDKYYMSISRFAISHMSIPIMFWEANKYSVSVYDTIANVEIQTFCAPVTTGAYAQFTGNPVFYYWQIQQSINTALRASYNLIPALAPHFTPPFEFYMEQNLAAFVNVSFNAPLFQLFQYFPAFFNGYNQPYGSDYTLFSSEKLDESNLVVIGGNTYIKMTQEREALYLFNQIQSIVFYNRSLAITNEYGETKDYSPNASSLESAPVMIDFVPNMNAARDLSEYQYYQTGRPHLIEIGNIKDINHFIFDIAVQGRNGKVYPLYLEPGETVKVKFAFYKKSLFNSQYTKLDDLDPEEKKELVSVSKKKYIN